MPGYIIIADDAGLILGTGATPDEAWIDAEEWGLREHREKLAEEALDVPAGFAMPDPRDGFTCLPATDALIAQVTDDGGNVAWGWRRDGTACTVDEEA